MKSFSPLFACLLLLWLLPADVAPAASALQADAGGITLDVPEGNKIEVGTTLSVSFPSAMVAADQIDLAGAPCPVRFDPPVAGDWLWKSQTDGGFTVKAPLAPGLQAAVRLVPGLRDQGGHAVAPNNWGAELHTAPFTVEAEATESDQREAMPGVVLKFSYPVRLAEVAGRIYFQDRDSHARQESELSLHADDRDDDQPENAVLRATPRAPLPAGRTWDLIVENVREDASGVSIPYLKSVPLGVTAPLTVKWAGGFNLPLEGPLIRVRTNDYLDPATLTLSAISVTPPVPGLKATVEDEDVVLRGEFDTARHYEVAIQPSVRGRRGFAFAAPVRWGATFRPMASALFFPAATISERTGLGLRFSFLQVHTGPLRWRLAAVPLEKLSAVNQRVREFNNPKINPVTKEPATLDNGETVPYPTTLLVDTLGLETKAQGNFPASAGEVKDLREIRWPSGPGGVPPGAYLLEVDGPAWDGKRTVGQRSVVLFSESVITEKRSRAEVLARVAGMADGLPRAGIPVRAVSAGNFEVARGVTDNAGLVRFDYAQLHPGKGERGGQPAQMLVADTPQGPSMLALEGESLSDNYVSSESPTPPKNEEARGMTLTDRSLYRPGQTVRFKGLVRAAPTPRQPGDDEKLRVPVGAEVAWQIRSLEKSDVVAEGRTTVDADGGWEAEWTIPTAAMLGEYSLDVPVSEAAQGQIRSAYFHVQEYKVPLFEVGAVDPSAGKPGATTTTAACAVRAAYFSGQPVAGAKVAWRVHWEQRDYLQPPDRSADDIPDTPDRLASFQLDDTRSEHAKPPADDASSALQVSGEGRLDGRGEALFQTELPRNLAGVRYVAHWEIAVTSADGQSVAAAHPPDSVVMRQPVLLGVSADPDENPDGGVASKTLLLRVAAFDKDDHPARVREARLEVFRVTEKTVRENVAPSVVRYRNTSVYTPVKTLPLKEVVPGAPPLEVPYEKAGRYVAVASSPGLQQVSAEATVGGPEEDEVPVRTQTSLEISLEKKEYLPGDKAACLTRSPVSGVAWVSIETDHVIDSVLVPLPGNTTRIEFPVKPQYAPNATVAVYLLRPGGGDRLPAERFGRAGITVRRPDRLLEVRPALEAARVRPGDEVRGSVHIVSGGQPVRDADTTLWAVDDAILALGEWKSPVLSTVFYPRRQHEVQTYAALRDYVADIPAASLFEKGFIIGGGGEEFGAKTVRKDFQPLAYWKTGLKTDAGGNVQFAFAAPDNLTRYRVIAVAQTRDGRFGEGEGSVEISKPLIVEPSLPRFVRAGDEVELRAVARQSVEDTVNLAVRCAVEGGLALDPSADQPAPVTAKRDAPAVFRFRARVPEGAASAKITLSGGVAGGGDPEMSDAVQVSLPVLPPTILRRETGMGPVTAGGDVAGLLPEEARRAGAVGSYDVAVSTSPDLSRLQALPAVLEYPHGCFEQMTSRILVYCGVQDLLADLPAEGKGKDRFKGEVQKALDLCARAVSGGGFLPYWPGDKTDNPFVTIQAAWAARLAVGTGLAVDQTSVDRLAEGLKKIVADTSEAGTLRAFALLVQATPSSGNSDDEENGTGFDEEAARGLFLNRESLGDEGRALLAAALHRAKVMPNEQRQLLREILPLATGTRPAPERAFDPATFASAARVASVAVWAMAEVRPPEWKATDAVAAKGRLGKVLDRAPLNSTQENLWALLAFQAVRKAENAPRLRLTGVQPPPARLAPNGTAVQWIDLKIGLDSPPFRVPAEIAPAAGAARSCLLMAEYRVGRAEEGARRDRGGMRVERVVRNLTEPTRTGRPGEKPYQLNDRLLVTYRLQTPKPRWYVALEDELPAALETVNPDLPLFASFYDLPPVPAGQHVAALSSSALRDHTTQLYFDHLEPGVSLWSVLARVTAAGNFQWPATQAGPMYEPAVNGLAPSERISATGD